MSKASEWANSYGKRPTFWIKIPLPGITLGNPWEEEPFAFVADNGHLGFYKSSESRLECIHGNEGIRLARWILDTFGEEEIKDALQE